VRVRSINEIRQAKLDELKHMVRRPDMWAGDGRSAQTLIQGAIGDLCFIDEREAEYSAKCDVLYRYGKLGVAGAFRAVFGETCNYTAEVASVFTEIACSLSYLEPARRLSAVEWQSLIASIHDKFEEVDVRRSVVLEQIGEPSFDVGTRVLCYAGPSNGDWVAFDCWEETASKYIVEDGYLKHGFFAQREEDPLLRCVRIPADSFNESLVMTIYGKVLRWGPGWWLDTEPACDTEIPDGIREQLQDIDKGDPSQSLGPRRPWNPPRRTT
jgi:hypothetical protein